MTNAILNLTGNTTDIVLAHLAQISKDLSVPEQLSQLNNMLAILSDLKATEGLIQAMKNDLISKVYSEKVHTEFSNNLLRVVYSEADELLSIPEIAKHLGCTRQTVYNTHFKNGLKYIQPTGPKGNKKVKRSELEKYLSEMN